MAIFRLNIMFAKIFFLVISLIRVVEDEMSVSDLTPQTAGQN